MSDHPYGSPEWLAERRSYLGASDMPLVVGVSEYGGPLDLARVKLGLDVVEETHPMRRGHIYEPAIAAEYAVLHPEHTLSETGTHQLPGKPWLRARPDRLIQTRAGTGVWEAKMVTPYLMDAYGESGSDLVPDDKLVQVQTQLHVLNLSFAVLVVNFGFETREYPIERDRELGQALEDAAHDFWFDYVAKGELPPPTPRVDTLRAIQRTYTLYSNVLRPAEGDVAAWVAEYGELTRVGKEVEARRDELKALLATAIGRDYGVELPSGERVIWPESKGRASLNTEALIRDLNVPEDVLDKYRTRGAPYRTLRYYPAKSAKPSKTSPTP